MVRITFTADPSGAKNVGNGQGKQFITGGCVSNAECASKCCALQNKKRACALRSVPSSVRHKLAVASSTRTRRLLYRLRASRPGITCAMLRVSRPRVVEIHRWRVHWHTWGRKCLTRKRFYPMADCTVYGHIYLTMVKYRRLTCYDVLQHIPRYSGILF